MTGVPLQPQLTGRRIPEDLRFPHESRDGLDRPMPRLSHDVEEGLRARLLEAEPSPRPKTLRVSMPEDLRRATLPDLPANVSLSVGRLEIQAPTAEAMLESLVTLTLVIQDDLDRFRDAASRPWLLHRYTMKICAGCSSGYAEPNSQKMFMPELPSAQPKRGLQRSAAPACALGSLMA